MGGFSVCICTILKLTQGRQHANQSNLCNNCGTESSIELITDGWEDRDNYLLFQWHFEVDGDMKIQWN